MELICTESDLARWLGAVRPETMAQHKEMRDRGDLLVRSLTQQGPLFWPWRVYVPGKLSGKST
jgi:hypothetical protein